MVVMTAPTTNDPLGVERMAYQPRDPQHDREPDVEELLTVGQVADAFGVTVRTLHHYDEIGLVVPSERSRAGYRLYAGADLTRLQHVVVYRRLGFSLEDVSDLLADTRAGGDIVPHLQRQRDAVMSRLDELSQLVRAIDRALEKEMTGFNLTKDEQRELFGDGFSEEYQEEARERWGDTDAWRQSQARTAHYAKADWEAIKAEGDELNAAYAAAMGAGEPPTGETAMDVAERARAHIERWFYDLPHSAHNALAEMYVGDERFARNYESLAPGLAAYVRDAIRANGVRHGAPDIAWPANREG